jgi:hypothetical protein
MAQAKLIETLGFVGLGVIGASTCANQWRSRAGRCSVSTRGRGHATACRERRVSRGTPAIGRKTSREHCLGAQETIAFAMA